MVEDTWSPTAPTRTLKYLLADVAKQKARANQLYFIKAFLQAKLKNRVVVKLDMRYKDYFPDYAKYFGRALRLLNLMYGMTNYYKYAQYGSKIVFYVMLRIVSIGIQMKILENGLLTPWERYYI